MSSAAYWEIDDNGVRELTPAIRTWLVQRMGWTNVPAHTYAAIVHVRESGDGGTRCLVSFVFSVTASEYTGRTGELEDAIEAEVRTRLRAMRNADQLTSIIGRRHPL